MNIGVHGQPYPAENRRGVGLCQYKLTMSVKSSQLEVFRELNVRRASEGRVGFTSNMDPWLVIMGMSFEHDRSTPGNETKDISVRGQKTRTGGYSFPLDTSDKK